MKKKQIRTKFLRFTRPMHRLFWGLCVGSGTLLWGGCPPLSPQAQASPQPVFPILDVVDPVAALQTLQTQLTFQGEPLNPRSVAVLLPWLSDTLPGAIAVDIAGSTADTNQFSATVYQDEWGRTVAEWEDRRFMYQPVGQLNNGTQVLRTWLNTGGSGVFQTPDLQHP